MQLEIKQIATKVLFGVATLVLFHSCRKDAEVFPGNTAPVYNEIPTVLVENYINRLFIDLLGREPLDVEMDQARENLRAEGLRFEAREALIDKLQTDTTFLEGDTSYKHAYYNRLYELFKSSFIEGASNAIINNEIGLFMFQITLDSLEGDSAGVDGAVNEVNKLKAVKHAEWQYREGTIGIQEVHKRMVNNALYDKINMNSFNFVNATFDDLFNRYPTQNEFESSYDMVEFNVPRILFGISGQNKEDYADILMSSNEFYEGVIRWSYTTFLARNPSTEEVVAAIVPFLESGDLQKVQRDIMKTDEYANFN